MFDGFSVFVLAFAAFAVGWNASHLLTLWQVEARNRHDEGEEGDEEV